ncbi:MAG: putative ATP-grasp superfamily ATP-dependent carboligase [Motiliproteus sp.]|jgi:predicted ATP-grasp superfamily ATP-dependent carboligase
MNTTQKSWVIVVGVDSPIGVSILRDLGKHGHPSIGIGYSAEAIGFQSKFCTRSLVRSNQESTFIEQLNGLVEDAEPLFLIAISESDISLLNRHRDALHPAIKLLIPTADIFARVVDKSRCLEIARDLGIETPASLSITRLEQLKNLKQILSFPLILKWADPNEVQERLSLRGLAVIKCDYCLDYETLYAKLSRYQPLGIFPMIQTYCRGYGLGQMFLMSRGEVLLEFQHQRLNEWPPEGGISTLCRSLPLTQHRQCRNRSIALLRALEWEGVAMVEYRFDPVADSYSFMEINGRFWGSLPLAEAAGVSFPSTLVAAAAGDLESVAARQRPYAELSCRYMIPDTKRLLRIVLGRKNIKDPHFSPRPFKEISKYLGGFFNINQRYYLFSRTDLGPCIKDLKNVFLKLRACFIK